jgi:hypothetical protein
LLPRLFAPLLASPRHPLPRSPAASPLFAFPPPALRRRAAAPSPPSCSPPRRRRPCGHQGRGGLRRRRRRDPRPRAPSTSIVTCRPVRRRRPRRPRQQRPPGASDIPDDGIDQLRRGDARSPALRRCRRVPRRPAAD